MMNFLSLLAEVVIPIPEALKQGDAGGDSRFLTEFFNMLFILGLLVATLYIGAWIFRRMAAQRTMQINENSKIKIVEQRMITAKSALFIIEIGGKTMLVSESMNGVTFLTDLPN